MSLQSPHERGTSSDDVESRSYFRALGKRITELRKAMDMTQAELAREIGFSQQTVFAYELGDRRVSIVILIKLARVFGIPVEQLLGIAPTQPDPRPLASKWVRHVRRMRRLSKTDQRFILKVLDVLEQERKPRPPGAHWGLRIGDH